MKWEWQRLWWKCVLTKDSDHAYGGFQVEKATREVFGLVTPHDDGVWTWEVLLKHELPTRPDDAEIDGEEDDGETLEHEGPMLLAGAASSAEQAKRDLVAAVRQMAQTMLAATEDEFVNTVRGLD